MKNNMFCVVVLCVMYAVVKCKVIIDLPYEKSPASSPLYQLDEPKRRCPVCDPSVFSYCGEKLFHDSCCCSNPNNPYYPLPPECNFADCSFLHANSCVEHKMITACCCLHK